VVVRVAAESGEELGWLRRRDERLLEMVTSNGGVVADAIMPGASRIADRLLVWWLIAAVVAAGGDERSRRAVARAVLAMVVAGPISNLARTQIFDRTRPPGSLRARRPGRVPDSPGFPSGHTAAAAAFAATLVYETSPQVSVPVAGLAAVVAYSRLYTGAHYPGDVVAGTTVGIAVAALVCRLSPAAVQRLRR
jgi:membrane-associated phospholipid phosphatase